MEIGDRTYLGLLDTGSLYTLMNHRVWEGIKGDYILKESPVKLSGAGGMNLKVKGRVSGLRTTMNSADGGRVEFLLDVIVVQDLRADMILGIHYLSHQKGIINLNSLKVNLRGREFNLISADPPEASLQQVNKVKSVGDVTIRPGQWQEVRVRTGEEGLCSTALTCLTSEQFKNTELTVVSTVVNLVAGEAVLTVVNEGHGDVTLPEGSEIDVSPMTKVVPVDTSVLQRELPAELWDKARINNIQSMVNVGYEGAPQGILDETRELIREFADCFLLEGEVREGPDISVKLTPLHNIPVIDRPAKIGLHQVEPLEEELKKLLRAGVIRPSVSPYCSRMFLVRKGPAADNKWRAVNDFRLLNRLLPDRPTEVEPAEVLLSRFGKNKYFASLDLKASYHQLNLAEESRHLTSFSVNKVKFEYCKLAMGLKSSSAYLVGVVRQMLAGIPEDDCLSYMDDLVIMLEQVEDFPRLFRTVLERLRSSRLYLSAHKCYILRTEIRFLGFVVSYEKLSVDPMRVQSLLETETPRTMTQVRSILGAASFLRAHIPRFEDIVQGLRDDLREATARKKAKKGPIALSEAGVASFKNLLNAIANTIDLSFPPKDKDLVLYCDASDHSIGGCLMFYDEQQNPRPLAFYSKKIPDSIKANHINNKEAFALVKCVEKLDFFLKGRHFWVLSDNKTICSPNYCKTLTRPIHLRWLDILSQYHFTLQHIPSSANVLGDFLSRKDSPEEATTHQPPAKEGGAEGWGSRGLGTWETLEQEEAEEEGREDAVHLIQRAEPRKNKDGQGMSKAFVQEMVSGGLSEAGATAYKKNSALASSVRAEQRADPVTGYLIKCLEEGTDDPTPRSPSADLSQYLGIYNLLFLDGDGCLYYRSYLKWSAEETCVMCIPVSLQGITISFAHEGLGAGHLSATKLYERMKERFYFPGMEDACQYHVRSCLVCQKIFAEHSRKPKASVESYTSAWPSDLLFMDVAHIRESSIRDPDQFNYILVIADDYSSYIMARPLKSLKADVMVHEILTSVIPVTSIPGRIRSDNGREFANSLFKDMTDSLGILHEKTPARRPNSNKSEVMIKLLKSAIKKSVAENPKDWYKMLGLLCLSLNCSKQKYSAVSAHEKFFGRRGTLPLDQMYGDKTMKFYKQAVDPRGGFYSKVKTLARVLHSLKLRTLEYGRTYANKATYDLNLQEGALVLIKRPPPSKTKFRGLKFQYVGPYTVYKKAGRATYVISDGGRRMTVHQDSLQPLRENPRGRDDNVKEALNAIRMGAQRRKPPLLPVQQLVKTEGEERAGTGYGAQEKSVKQPFHSQAPLADYFTEGSLRPVRSCRKTSKYGE